MNIIKKFYPFLPAKGSIGHLILAFLIYYIAIPTVAYILSVFLGLTLILFPVAMVISYVSSFYYVTGFILSVISFLGIADTSKCDDQEF